MPTDVDERLRRRLELPSVIPIGKQVLAQSSPSYLMTHARLFSGKAYPPIRPLDWRLHGGLIFPGAVAKVTRATLGR